MRRVIAGVGETVEAALARQGIVLDDSPELQVIVRQLVAPQMIEGKVIKASESVTEAPEAARENETPRNKARIEHS